MNFTSSWFDALFNDAQNRQPVPILVGPTASGKSSLALQLATQYPVEIISIDSALVYRGMDIGTAKPTVVEQSQVAHHLIDILEPTQSYSAAQFCEDALNIIPQVLAKGKIPLLVGGTMLYVKALMEGLDELPPVNLAVRKTLEEQQKRSGNQALYALLQQHDPVTAARLKVSDTQRIIRALEVCLDTGKAFSSFHSNQAKQAAVPYHFVLCSLEQFERSMLHQRIEQRLSVMFDQGFVDEVVALRARGDLVSDMPSMRCVGYRQVWEYLEGLLSEQEMRDKSLFATRQLAKRQYTWLRSMSQRHVLDLTGDDMNRIVEHICNKIV